MHSSIRGWVKDLHVLAVEISDEVDILSHLSISIKLDAGDLELSFIWLISSISALKLASLLVSLEDSKKRSIVCETISILIQKYKINKTKIMKKIY